MPAAADDEDDADHEPAGVKGGTADGAATSDRTTLAPSSPARPSSSVDRFLAAPWRKEGLAASTRKAYAYELAKLAVFLAPTPLNEATEVQLREYLLDTHQRGVKAAAIRRATIAIRSYFAWLAREGARPGDPARSLDVTRPPKAPPQLLGPRRAEALVHGDQTSELRERLRDRAMLEVLYGAGLRLGELLKLKPLHVDLSAGTVVVHGPGARSRTVPLPIAAVAAVADYLAQGRAAYVRPAVPSDYLFLTRLGGPLTHSGFRRHLRNRAVQVGLDPDRVSASVLRLAFARAQLKDGQSLEAVQALLGHTAATTTADTLQISR